MALKLNLTSFEFDAVDAYCQAPETEECYAAAPEAYEERLRAAGKDDDDVVWRLLKQLPGRRAAGQHWVDHDRPGETLRGLRHGNLKKK